MAIAAAAAATVLLFLAVAANAAAAAAAATTAHGELQHHNFPPGLLPAAVLSHTLNATTGAFTLRLPAPDCRVTLPPDNYLASYAPSITGRLQDRRIADLHGIRVRAFFKWWEITGIRAQGENLVFEVAGVTVKYPARNFGVTPQCEGMKADS